jgi:ribosomal protein S18 acetylase RimI-like enzyme
VETWRAAYRGLMSDAVLASLSVSDRQKFWEQRLRLQQANVLVAVDGDDLIGWLVYGASRDPDASPTVVEVYGLYVAPFAWRRGAGRMLWREAKNRISQGDAEVATLWVLEGNERARRFYEAIGFELDAGRSKQFTRQDTVLPEVRYRARLR